MSGSKGEQTTRVNADDQVSDGSSAAVLVLGMHRSGTSVLTRVINLLGADLPSHLMPALDDNNDTGFWESLDIFDLNNEILASVGSDWDDWQDVDPEWIHSSRAQTFKVRAIEMLEQDFALSSLFVLKDPRICRLLPFWMEVLDTFGVELKCVLPLRNPLEVFASLKVRDSFTIAKSQMLWLRYVLDAEHGSRGLKRVFITYEGLIEDWRAVVDKVSSELDLSWPRSIQSVESEIDSFAVDRHRHHRIDDDAVYSSNDVARWVKEAYSALLELSVCAGGPEALERLDRVRLEFNQAGDVLGTLLAAEEAAWKEPGAVSALWVDKLKSAEAEQKCWVDTLDAMLAERAVRLAEREEQIAGLARELDRERARNRELMSLKNRILHQLNGIQNDATGQIARPIRALEASAPGLLRRLVLIPKITGWLVSFRLPQRLRIRKQANELLATHLFDRIWYVEHNPEVVLADQNPVFQWLTIGWMEGRNPNPMFDTRWYIDQNPEVAESGMNPLEHYLRIGAAKGLWPHPSFDTQAYVEQHPELVELGLNPLVHYLAKLHEEGQAALVSPVYEGSLPSQQGESLAVSGQTVSHGGVRQMVNYYPAQRWKSESEGFRPDVTVVVPCYNHAPFLRERLDSIYEQSYLPSEVLLLDDCSSDGSQDILREYAERYPEITSLFLNEQNSGSVFRQWMRGTEVAKSPLVWIAESDDLCDRHFLATLVPYFADEAVMLAYSRSVFIDEDGKPLEFSFEGYVGELSQDKWASSYVETAHKEVETALGRKNTIPNVSSAMFRHPHQFVMLLDSGWEAMRICGDWLFYLYLIRGGKLAYSVDCNNYYRIHGNNSSAATYSTPAYYQEHETIARYIARWFEVSADTLKVHYEYIKRFFNEQGQTLVQGGHGIADYYSTRRVESEVQNRKPNIMVSAFSFAVGGGEVFPIRLANALKRQGFPVTFFDFSGGEYNQGVRELLDSDIPVVERISGDEAIAETAKMLDDYGIDIVHSHHACVDPFFARVKAEVNKPLALVVTMHGMYEALDAQEFYNTTEVIGNSVDAWVYISKKNLAPFQAAGLYADDKFTKIPNGMEIEAIEPVERARFKISTQAFVLCLASRAIAEKGWYTAVEATDAARRISGMDIHLLLLGEGPVYDELSRKALPSYIHMPGFINNTIRYYAMADVGLLPSTFKGESFPLTIIECLMAGKPVIASDIGEIRTMLTNEEGEVAGELIDVESGVINVVWLIQQIVALATDRDVYEHKTTIATEIASRFEMNNVISQYVDVYAKVWRQME